ncbi:sensor histidine kinase [Pseudonocardia charpentierae]|uniref:Sensor histidine kinase n=1 Tax=Pseudonocardia charpentierae TaxID=3075545 RepID=A0ABU2NKT7_9PSEU|nr:sensor histidine kinase [Pseudonocardia sp. DSM 45834]MDT0354058.1 sensor histidine kinase [Pseudonocardia sp. DSM 45834]
MLIAVPNPNLERLHATLSPAEVAQVRWRDMRVAGRNPGRIIGSVLRAFVNEHSGRRVRIVSEAVWPDRTDLEYQACAEHEALLNLALADAPVHVLCPYDAAALPRHVLTDAARTHPTVTWRGERRASAAYTDPYTAAASFDGPLSPTPDDAEILVVNTITGPRTARRLSYEFGQRMGLPPQRLDDLKITAHELALNSILHSGGAGLLSIWAAEAHVVVQTEDGGQITDPLVGRHPAGPAEIGHGLSVVHQVGDLVRIHRTENGTTVRAYFRLPQPIERSEIGAQTMVNTSQEAANDASQRPGRHSR